MKVKTGLVTGGSERIAFSIVRVDVVRYPNGIVGIVLQYSSSNKIYLCIETMSYPDGIVGIVLQYGSSNKIYLCIETMSFEI